MLLVYKRLPNAIFSQIPLKSSLIVVMLVHDKELFHITFKVNEFLM
jgi:hypothetical protein